MITSKARKFEDLIRIAELLDKGVYEEAVIEASKLHIEEIEMFNNIRDLFGVRGFDVDRTSNGVLVITRFVWDDEDEDEDED